MVIESAIGKTEEFIYANGKSLLTALAVIVVVAGGYFGYKYMYAAPRAEKAAGAIYVAEQLFAVDSFALALNGDGNNDGFLQVIGRYGSTPQGNVAKHYAGICYLKLGDQANALKYLSMYKSQKGAPAEIINAQNLGLQGDINMQQGKDKEAAAFYDNAVAASANPFTAPIFLKKAGLCYEKLGDKKTALERYGRIRDEFGSSMEARDIDKYIGRAEQ